MGKPGIPLDIVQTARAVYAKLGRGSTADEAVIAQALAAEREACAVIADRLAANASTTSATITRLQSEAAERVAAAIRKGAA